MQRNMFLERCRWSANLHLNSVFYTWCSYYNNTPMRMCICLYKQCTTSIKIEHKVCCNLPSTDSTANTPQATDPAPPPSPSWPSMGNNGEAGKYCCLCGAWFNNPLMAQQHYEGKKHKRNAARARLLEQLAGSLDATESTGKLGL